MSARSVAATLCPPRAVTKPLATSPPIGDLGVQPGNLEQLTTFVESIGAGWSEAVRFSGFVLVAQHDQPIYARAFGLADRERKRAATADTSFRIGSVTKAFTAAAIMRLEQMGKLTVSDTVEKHLTEYPGAGKYVTIHQLLTHTGGLPSYTADPTVLSRKGERWTVPALLASFSGRALEFVPGSDHAYSSSGYAVLGAIVERASGRDYATFVRQELFAPAGMTRTVVGDAERDLDRALGYQARGNSLRPADPIDLSMAYASGGIRSTASDLLRWHRALEGDAILSGKTRARLYVPALANYAYGWFVEPICGRRALWHNGTIDGFRADYWRIPDADLVVVVLGNCGEIDTQPIAKAAVTAAFGQALQPLAQPRPIEPAPALVPRLVGAYRITTESRRAMVESKASLKLIHSLITVTITGTESGLIMKPNGREAIQLAPTGIAEFYDPASNIKASFDFARTRSALRLTVEKGPLTITYRRAR
jgi:D-alanyl-D-alanine carboxypeptidase